MALKLVFEDMWEVSVAVDRRLHEALAVQRERAVQTETVDPFTFRLSACIANSLATFLDLDLQLPSPNQVKYATDIAREIGVAMPAEALRYRGACSEFIARFEDAFKASREHGSSPR